MASRPRSTARLSLTILNGGCPARSSYAAPGSAARSSRTCHTVPSASGPRLKSFVNELEEVYGKEENRIDRRGQHRRRDGASGAVEGARRRGVVRRRRRT